MLPTKYNTYFPTEQLNSDPFLGLIYNKLHVRDENFIMPITGQTGSGKSGSAISLAINIDVDKKGYTRWYYYDRSGEVVIPKIVFTAKQFLDLLKTKLPKGSVIIWDEAGVENDNTEFQSTRSKMIKWVLQTFRFKNLALFLTVPDIESIALSTRRLMHAQLKILGDPPNELRVSREKYRYSKPYFIEKTFGGKLIYSRFRYYDELASQKIKVIDGYLIPKPPKDVFKQYQEKKKEAVEELYKNIREDIEYVYSVIGVRKSLDDYIQIIKQNPQEYIYKDKFSTYAISAKLDISLEKARKIAHLMNIEKEKELEKGG